MTYGSPSGAEPIRESLWGRVQAASTPSAALGDVRAASGVGESALDIVSSGITLNEFAINSSDYIRAANSLCSASGSLALFAELET